MIRKLVVVNNPEDFQVDIEGVEKVTAKDYLLHPRFAEMPRARVFNLCRDYIYQSDGYYISLLAEARGHRVVPDIQTIQDTKTQSIIRIKSEEYEDLIQKALRKVEGEEFELDIIFGRTRKNRFARLGQELFNHFQSPILRAFFSRTGNKKWKLQDIDPISTRELQEEDRLLMQKLAERFFSKAIGAVKQPHVYNYDIAILMNPNDDSPPSDEDAIRLFEKAAEELRIGTSRITRDDYGRIAEYDGLFIRETTNVNHHTYRIARRAAISGLVVLDDPESIMRCSNKVYLAELLKRHDIPRPKTLVVQKENLKELPEALGFPIILKLPDSCSSKGVKKADNEKELKQIAGEMFRLSDLIIAQAYLYTDFDWRIGIIDGQPFYACKYYMAKGHWQITEWEGAVSKHGPHKAVPVSDVPENVLVVALKAAALIGNGLYGVDVKEVDGKPYIIEVNDNPSIEHEVEDAYAGMDVYRTVMQVFLQRMEASV